MSRIIAGAARGLRLATPRGDRTRPTSERVREAVFSALASWQGTGDVPPASQLDGVAFLDLYAGSGAVGLEAASRGAARVTLVESHPATARLVARNVEAARPGLPSQPVIEVVTRDVSACLAQAGQGYDVVWLDPPYDVAIDEVLARVVAGGWLVDDGLLVAERATRAGPPVWPAPFTTTWLKTYGDTTVHYARRYD